MKPLIARIMASRPLRVFTHYGNSGGSVLAGGMAYQSIFAIFAAIWVLFSIAGLFLTSNAQLSNSLFTLINQSIPGLIGPDGIIDPEMLSNAGVFSWTGAIALVGLLSTALAWLSTTALAVRTIFGMPRQTTFFVWVKLRELGLGLGFGLVLILSAVISLASTAALSWVFGLFNVAADSLGYTIVAQLVGLALVLAIDTLTLCALFRVLSRVRIPFRRLVAGSLLGAGALGVLKLLGGALLGGASSNPLLATFAVIIGLLIWFHLVSTVTLLSAAWIAVGMADAGLSTRNPNAAEVLAEREKREAEAYRVVVEGEVRDARQAHAEAPWYGKWLAARRLRAARTAAAAERAGRAEAASASPPPK